jgi:hypothetical protein
MTPGFGSHSREPAERSGEMALTFKSGSLFDSSGKLKGVILRTAAGDRVKAEKGQTVVKTFS